MNSGRQNWAPRSKPFGVPVLRPSHKAGISKASGQAIGECDPK